jgi:hypothetical protein
VACGFAPAAAGEPPGGALLCCGGYSARDGALSHAQVTALHVSPDAIAAGTAAAQAGPTRESVLRGVSMALLAHSPMAQFPSLPLPDEMFAHMDMRYEQRQHADVDWAALLERALALPRGAPGSQAVATWQEVAMSDNPRAPPLFQMSVTRNDAPGHSVTDFFAFEPEAGDVARQLLLMLVPPPGTACATRPADALFAARLGGEKMRACAPLLELLGIAPVLEPWTAAAESALMYDTNPWGYNAVKRCVRCRRAADGHLPSGPPALPGAPRLKLRSCGECKLASYCGNDCQRADWGSHKEMCRFACEWKRKNGKA